MWFSFLYAIRYILMGKNFTFLTVVFRFLLLLFYIIHKWHARFIKIHNLKVFELHLLSIHLLILPSKLWFILKIALWRHYRHKSHGGLPPAVDSRQLWTPTSCGLPPAGHQLIQPRHLISIHEIKNFYLQSCIKLNRPYIIWPLQILKISISEKPHGGGLLEWITIFHLH